jgi:hypothetical protein
MARDGGTPRAGGAATLAPASRKVKRAPAAARARHWPPSGTGIPQCLEPPESPVIPGNPHDRPTTEHHGSPCKTATSAAQGSCIAPRRSRTGQKPRLHLPRRPHTSARIGTHRRRYCRIKALVPEAAGDFDVFTGPENRRSPAICRASREGERGDSNPRPPGPQPGALPTELRPPRRGKQCRRSGVRELRRRTHSTSTRSVRHQWPASRRHEKPS